MGLAVTGMHYTGMAALSVHAHGSGGTPAGDTPAELLAPLMIGPLCFLLLAGVVVVFDPMMMTGRPDRRDVVEAASRAGRTVRPLRRAG